MTERSTVLIVEDEWIIGRAMQQNLERADHTVTAVVSTAADAVRSLNNERPSLALLDIRLQGEEDGLELAVTLRDRNIPFIFVTAHCDAETLRRATELGPLSFVRKPFSGEELLDCVESGLRRCTSRDVASPRETAFSSLPEDTEGERRLLLQRLAAVAFDESKEYRREPQLSRREVEIVRLLVKGETVKSIADQLKLSQITVQKYFGSVFRKTGVHSKVELILKLEQLKQDG